jgi:hypothetical protein
VYGFDKAIEKKLGVSVLDGMVYKKAGRKGALRNKSFKGRIIL